MADSMVNSALLRLEGMAFDAVKQQTEVSAKVQGLRDDLAWLRLLLRDADRRRRQEVDEFIEVWVRQTREVAFDAEDLLDEYLHRGRLHFRSVVDVPSFFRWLHRGANGIIVSSNIFTEIDEIKARLVQIKAKAVDNNLRLQGLPAPTWVQRQKHYLGWTELIEYKMGDPKKLVGINENLGYIENWIAASAPSRQRTVVTITGKSGAGKTMLASCVYGSKKVRDQFDFIIWVHVPKKFRLLDILNNIHRQTNMPDDSIEEHKDVESAISALTARLSKGKYLIVLDDVRSLEELKLFLSVLPECKEEDKDKGSKGDAVVITMELKTYNTSGASSSKNVKDTSEGMHLWHHSVVLNKMEKESAGEVFCRRVFGKSSFPDDFANNAQHAKDIEELLDSSLPLAGTLLAGVLRTKKEKEWAALINQLKNSPYQIEEDIKEREKQQQSILQQSEEEQKQHGEKKQAWQLEVTMKYEKESEVIMKYDKESEGPEQQQGKPVYRQLTLLSQILMLSFDDLPPYLKQCFLYFSAFRAEDHISAEKLIRLWVAEGLVRPADGRTMEKNAREYLRMLISRCLVNLVKMDYSNNIITVSIHERILAFVRSEAHEINFLQVHHSITSLPSTAIRRLSIQNAFDPYTSLTLATPKLRSLLCECPKDPYANDGSPTCVPYISKVSEFIMGRVHSLNIYQCKFLRVIDLKGMMHGLTLPHEIGWLIYLQYLGLECTGLKKLPRTISNLRNLQTLDITGTKIELVPKGFWKIKTLRHVLADDIRNGPKKVNVSSNLQTLHGVHWKGTELKKLINLQSLGIQKIPHGAGLDACLLNMECLTFLDLKGTNLPLHKLLSMPALRNLQSLKLESKVLPTSGKKQKYGHDYLLHNLTKLELRTSELDQEDVNMIAKVPNLVDLFIGPNLKQNTSTSSGEIAIPKDEFRKLRKLQIRGSCLKNLKVDKEKPGFRELEYVSISKCTILKDFRTFLEGKNLDHFEVDGKMQKPRESPQVENGSDDEITSS